MDLVASLLNHVIGAGRGMGPGVLGVEAVVRVFAIISFVLILLLRSQPDGSISNHSQPLPAAVREREDLAGDARHTWHAISRSSGSDLA